MKYDIILEGPNKTEPTDRITYTFPLAIIIVEVWNTETIFAWRMIVNNDPSPITSHYSGILCHKGYCLATDYWNGTIKPFVPFRCEYAVEKK